MEVVHHGGKASVTGSCHELRADGQALLIDCGLFQGADERPLAVEFALGHVDALILTHAHIDHIGRLLGYWRRALSSRFTLRRQRRSWCH